MISTINQIKHPRDMKFRGYAVFQITRHFSTISWVTVIVI